MADDKSTLLPVTCAERFSGPDELLLLAVATIVSRDAKNERSTLKCRVINYDCTVFARTIFRKLSINVSPRAVCFTAANFKQLHGTTRRQHGHVRCLSRGFRRKLCTYFFWKTISVMNARNTFGLIPFSNEVFESEFSLTPNDIRTSVTGVSVNKMKTPLKYSLKIIMIFQRAKCTFVK